MDRRVGNRQHGRADGGIAFNEMCESIDVHVRVFGKINHAGRHGRKGRRLGLMLVEVR